MIIQETPTLNLQFDKAKNDSDMLSLLKSQGGTFTRGSEVVGSGASVASYVDALGTVRLAKLGHPRPNFVDGVNQGLLIEEARTNRILNSEDFANASWDKSNISVLTNQVTSPIEGELADLLYPTTTGSFRRIADNTVSTTSGGTFTFFAKQAGIRFISIPNPGTIQNAVVSFDLQEGIIANNTGYYTTEMKVVGNGWYRCRVSYSGTDTFRGYFLLSDTSLSGNSTTNGTNGVYVIGAQMEFGSFPTSYISTAGTTVTRGAEFCFDDSNFTEKFNQNEGTFYGKFTYRKTDNSVNDYKGLISAIRTTVRGLFINIDVNLNRIRFTTRNDSGNSIAITAENSLVDGEEYGFAGSYNQVGGTLKLSLAGESVITTSSITNWDVPVEFRFDNRVWGGSDVNSQYTNAPKKFLGYLPKALTDAQLQLLSRI